MQAIEDGSLVEAGIELEIGQIQFGEGPAFIQMG